LNIDKPYPFAKKFVNFYSNIKASPIQQKIFRKMVSVQKYEGIKFIISLLKEEARSIDIHESDKT